MPLTFRSLGSGLRFAKQTVCPQQNNYYPNTPIYAPLQTSLINRPSLLGLRTWRPFYWWATKRKRPAAHTQTSPKRRSPFIFSAHSLKQNNNYVSGPSPHRLIELLSLNNRPFNITDIRLSRLPCGFFRSPRCKPIALNQNHHRRSAAPPVPVESHAHPAIPASP